MLDYDALIDISSNLAYPVFFKLKPSELIKSKKLFKKIK